MSVAHPETIGPYRILEPLGRGGMGVVYRACKGEDVVAVKTVTSLRSAALDSIRREIHALARLDHPGIVHIIEQGVAEGVPWYAMEVVPGTSLRQLLPNVPSTSVAESAAGRSWWTESQVHGVVAPRGRRRPRTPRKPPGRRALLSLLGRLAETLGYLHGEGIVHRDLKPENVVVRAPRAPVLVDFGLMSAFGGELAREALDDAERMSGTLLYMAPEQAAGELADARADLYALGCMLYEVLAGAPPFQAETPAELLRCHLSREPEPPSARVSGIHPELDALVLRLLAKEPRERLGHAHVVADILARHDGRGARAKAAPPVRPRAYVYRAGLQGRTEVWTELMRRLELLERGQGGLVLIAGESGIGKTRLTMELAAAARRRRRLVLVGTAPAPWTRGERRDAPLSVLRRPLRALADRCRELGPRETALLFGAWGRLLGAYEPSILDLPGVAAQPPPEELPLPDARLRLNRALAELLKAVAEARPALLALDDLQWADELSAGFLDYVRRSGVLEGVPLLVVATYREEEPGAMTELAAALDGGPLRLGRLDAAAVTEMVSDMLACDPPDPALTAFLGEKSEGNPLFVAEYLRGAVGDGLLRFDETGGWRTARPDAIEGLALPATLRDLLRHRIAALSPAARVLVEMAAVMGRDLDGASWLEASDVPSVEGLEASRELLVRQILEEPRSGTIRFSHDRLRETVYDDLAEARRRALHLRAAEVLTAGAAPDPATLAAHWELGDRPDLARPCYLEAARASRAGFDLDAAEQHYESYLGLAVESNAERIVARRELCEAVLHQRGDRDRAGQGLEQCLVEAEALDLEPEIAQCLRALGTFRQESGQRRDARELFERGLAIARRSGSRLTEGQLLGNLSEIAREDGDLAAATRLAAACLEIQRELGDGAAEAAALGNLALHAYHRSDPAEAERQFRLAIEAAHRQQARQLEARHLANLGLVLKESSRPDEAWSAFQQALEVARETGYRRLEASVLCNRAALQQERSDMDGALTGFGEALAIARELGDRRIEAAILLNSGVVHHFLGALDEARGRYEAALVVMREQGYRLNQANVLGNLGNLDLEQGRYEAARRHYDEAMRLAEETDNRRLLALIGADHGHLLALCGERDAARQRLESCLTVLLEVGERRFAALAECFLAQLDADEGGFDAARARCARAGAVLKELGDVGYEALALRVEARVERLAGAPADHRERLARAALGHALEVSHRHEEAFCQVEIGWAVLQSGRDVRPALARAESLARELGVGPDSELVRDLAELRRALGDAAPLDDAARIPSP